jgi:hypothetical protein
MKIKIGNTIYDSETEPIMIIFESDKDRKSIVSHISNMQDGSTKYVQYPNDMKYDDVKNFMKT